MIMEAIGHGVSPAMPAMPVLRVYRACESPSIILESRSAKTRAHELFSGALAAKAASFDGYSDSSFRELLELVVLQPVESQRPSPRLTPPAPRWRPPWAACPRTPASLDRMRILNPRTDSLDRIRQVPIYRIRQGLIHLVTV